MNLADHIRRPDHWARILGWATIAGLECGLIGPFGSYPANIFSRIFYWTALFWCGALILWPSLAAALRIGGRWGFPPFFSGAAAALVACLPLAALAAFGCYLFWPVHASGMRMLEWYGLTALVALPAAGGLVWLESIRARYRRIASAGPPGMREGAAAAQAPPATPPDHLIATALCLQMEDHHVRVHTRGRSYLHLAAMRDIVGAMDARRGLQVHRSWWVASEAVQGWHEENRAVTLILVNGLRVPVARNRVALLRAEGWLNDRERTAAPSATLPAAG